MQVNLLLNLKNSNKSVRIRYQLLKIMQIIRSDIEDTEQEKVERVISAELIKDNLENMSAVLADSKSLVNRRARGENKALILRRLENYESKVAKISLRYENYDDLSSIGDPFEDVKLLAQELEESLNNEFLEGIRGYHSRGKKVDKPQYVLDIQKNLRSKTQSLRHAVSVVNGEDEKPKETQTSTTNPEDIAKILAGTRAQMGVEDTSSDILDAFNDHDSSREGGDFIANPATLDIAVITEDTHRSLQKAHDTNAFPHDVEEIPSWFIGKEDPNMNEVDDIDMEEDNGDTNDVRNILSWDAVDPESVSPPTPSILSHADLPPIKVPTPSAILDEIASTVPENATTTATPTPIPSAQTPESPVGPAKTGNGGGNEPPKGPSFWKKNRMAIFAASLLGFTAAAGGVASFTAGYKALEALDKQSESSSDEKADRAEPVAEKISILNIGEEINEKVAPLTIQDILYANPLPGAPAVQAEDEAPAQKDIFADLEVTNEPTTVWEAVDMRLSATNLNVSDVEIAHEVDNRLEIIDQLEQNQRIFGEKMTDPAFYSHVKTELLKVGGYSRAFEMAGDDETTVAGFLTDPTIQANPHLQSKMQHQFAAFLLTQGEVNHLMM